MYRYIYMYLYVGDFTPQYTYIDIPTRPSVCLWSLMEWYSRVYGWFTDRVVLSGSYICSLIEWYSRVHRDSGGSQSTSIRAYYTVYVYTCWWFYRHMFADRVVLSGSYICPLIDRYSRVVLREYVSLHTTYPLHRTTVRTYTLNTH